MGVEFGNAYAILGAQLDAAIRAALQEATVVAAGWAKHAAESTADAAGHVGRVNTGEYVKSITTSPVEDRGAYYEANVFVRPPRDAIALVIEEGRKPNRPVSSAGVASIRKWVERKLLPTALLKAYPKATAVTRTLRNGKTVVRKVTGVPRGGRAELLDQLTYLVVRKIRRHGTPGIHPFGQARTRLDGPEGSAIVSAVLGRYVSGSSS